MKKKNFLQNISIVSVKYFRFWKGSCNTLSIAAVQPRRLVVLSTKSPGVPGRPPYGTSALAPLGARPLAGGSAAAKAKSMRATCPQTPRQGKIPCTPANQFAVFGKSRLMHYILQRFMARLQSVGAPDNKRVEVSQGAFMPYGTILKTPHIYFLPESVRTKDFHL